jgi:phage terminase large subunit-like protein
MAKSIMEQLAELSKEEREAILLDMDPEKNLWDWSLWGRPEQHAPTSEEWSVWLFIAGRGAGKTRTASEWVREEARYTNKGQVRFSLVARTAADVRDVIVEGESGILNVTPPSERPLYEPSKRRLTWPNGNMATCFTAEEPDALRGPQSTHAWGDEVAAWRQTPDAAGMTAFDNLRVGNRLGLRPRMILTTTPKRVPLLYRLIEESEQPTKRVVITRGSTMDNAGNLSEAYMDAILGVYDGTKLARQELYGEMMSDVEGALWTLELITKNTVDRLPAGVPLRVIGVDPTVSERPGDECGIVVVGSTGERDLYKRQAWVIEDATIQGAPEVWASKVVQMARKWGCPVVAEVNQGGALVRAAIAQIDPTIQVYDVWSKQGKALRAEPITMAYEQGRVHHVGYMPELTDQMTSWIPGDRGKSPDRVDALVHALVALLVRPPKGFIGGNISARSYSERRLPKFVAKGGGFRVR